MAPQGSSDHVLAPSTRPRRHRRRARPDRGPAPRVAARDGATVVARRLVAPRGRVSCPVALGRGRRRGCAPDARRAAARLAALGRGDARPAAGAPGRRRPGAGHRRPLGGRRVGCGAGGERSRGSAVCSSAWCAGRIRTQQTLAFSTDGRGRIAVRATSGNGGKAGSSRRFDSAAALDCCAIRRCRQVERCRRDSLCLALSRPGSPHRATPAHMSWAPRPRFSRQRSPTTAHWPEHAQDMAWWKGGASRLARLATAHSHPRKLLRRGRTRRW